MVNVLMFISNTKISMIIAAAKVLIFFNSHCIRTFPFIWKEYWSGRLLGCGGLLVTLRLLNEISMLVCLTSNAYLQIISEVNLVGMRQVSLFRGRVGPSAMGLLENKTDYTKVDAFPRALPRYTKKGKCVRYESLGKKIQTKSSICIIERFFLFIYLKLRY